MGSFVGIVVVIAIASLVPGIPAFVIAQRRGLSNPWVAFVPLVGFWIVLCESTGQSGWLGLIGIVPFLALVITIWMAFAVPVAHGRNRLWTVALVVPGINLVGYWLYAFTLPRTRLALTADALA
jgi:hypothetical protein